MEALLWAWVGVGVITEGLESWEVEGPGGWLSQLLP